MYNNGADVIDICKAKGFSISRLTLENEAKMQEKSIDDIRNELDHVYSVMYDACHKTLDNPIPSLSGLTCGNAGRVNTYRQNSGGLCGNTLLKGIAYALSCFEVNTSMGLIVAAPTAGSCGIVPGCIIAAAEMCTADHDTVLNALAVSACIGQIVTRNATVSGAEGGCQAECGTASAMAAAAMVEMLGGSVEQSFHGASIAFKNVMGQVCDPIAGLVEVPCANRNAIGVANAMVATDLALSGITSIVPFDEVVDTMYRVGRSMPYTLRETALGGLATTPTGKAIKKRMGTCSTCGLH